MSEKIKNLESSKIRAVRREEKKMKQKKMKISGKSVFQLKKIIKKSK